MCIPRHTLDYSKFIAIGCLLFLSGCDDASREQAQSQVARIAQELDNKTTETGVYIRVKADDLKETDPWGTKIAVTYSHGGVAETIDVRSAGPDRKFQTADDVVATGIAANLKGIGEGIKKNAEETAAKAATGVVKGTVKGVKESIKESLSFKKKTTENVADKLKEVPEADKPKPE